MEYKDFISKLHIKGAWLPKDEFTKQLFESSVRDTSVITDKRSSINTFKGYNRGNPINEIAYDVINGSTNLNESGIEVFIEKYLNNAPDKKFEYAQKICDKFKDQIPDITHENICKKIAIFFIDKVLRPAAEEYKNTRNIPKTASTGKDLNSIPETHNTESSTDNYVEVSDISIDPISIAPVASNNCYENYSNINITNTDINMIQNLIIDLSVSIETLLELGTKIKYEEDERRIYNREAFVKMYADYDNNYNKYQKLIKRFNFYCRKFQVSLFVEVFDLASKISKESFKISCNRTWNMLCSSVYNVFEFRDKIIELSSELDNYRK